MGFPLYLTCCFSLAAFSILSLCLVFVSCLVCVSPWVYPVWDYLCPLDLIDYFLFNVREFFKYNLFKNCLLPFLFLFSFWDPYNLNIGGFYIVWEVSETIFSSFLFFFTLFSSSEIISVVLSSSSLIHSSASDILLLIPSRIFLISFIVLFVSVCLFFNYPKSLWIDSYLYSILFSRFMIIFTIIIMNSFW